MSGFGWHGFHATAGVRRTVDNIDGAISNANGTTLLNCSAYNCGHFPGTDNRNWRVSPIQMGIALSAAALGWKEAMPISIIREVSAARSVPGGRSMTSDSWAIGTTCLSARTVYHDVTQWETDISTYSTRQGNPIHADPEERDFRTYNVPTGHRVQFAYHIENANARSILMNPYVEGAMVPPIVDVRAPSLVIGGIGGEDTRWTKRISSRGAYEWWKFTGNTFVQKTDETWLSESDPSRDPNLPLPPHGVFISLVANAGNRLLTG